MEIYGVTPNDFRVLPKMGLGSKNLYKVTELAESCKQRKLCGEHLATALRHCSSKTSKHIPKMQCGTVHERLQGCPGLEEPVAP